MKMRKQTGGILTLGWGAPNAWRQWHSSHKGLKESILMLRWGLPKAWRQWYSSNQGSLPTWSFGSGRLLGNLPTSYHIYAKILLVWAQSPFAGATICWRPQMVHSSNKGLKESIICFAGGLQERGANGIPANRGLKESILRNIVQNPTFLGPETLGGSALICPNHTYTIKKSRNADKTGGAS